VTVDPDICVGNAMCRAIAPDVFVETADGQSEVADQTGATEAAILEAAAYCPVGAILVVDIDTNETLAP
jgi:ferredoxin